MKLHKKEKVDKNRQNLTKIWKLCKQREKVGKKNKNLKFNKKLN